MPLIIAALFVLFVIGETLAGPLPRVVIATYGAVSILTFLVYWLDKSVQMFTLIYKLPCAFNKSESICATFLTDGLAFQRSM
jgi:hypothetical protein